MFDVSAIAAAHKIGTAELEHWVAARGWDFSKLDADDKKAQDFVTDVVSGYAEEIAAAKAKKAAAIERAKVVHLARLTLAARKNPDFSCYKCGGYGNIRGFDHVENGICFACKGLGVIRRKGS